MYFVSFIIYSKILIYINGYYKNALIDKKVAKYNVNNFIDLFKTIKKIEKIN